MPKEDLYSSEIPSKHCQMTGKCMSPGMEGCILDAESLHLVLESRLERMNIDLVAISLSEDPVGLPLLTAEKLIKSPMERDRSFFVAL